MQTKRVAIYVANSTRVPYLNVTQRYVHFNGFHARWLILFKIRIHVRNNMHYWMDLLLVIVRNEFYPV